MTNDDEDVRLAIEASLESHYTHVQETAQESKKENEEYDQHLSIAIHESIKTRQDHDKQVIVNETLNNYQIDRNEERNEGSWDCSNCTLVNPPYSKSCNACGHSAPTHVLTLQPIPPHLRFGLEIEIIIPRGKADGFDLNSIAKDMTRLGPEKIVFMGYSHQVVQTWKIVTDSTIQGSNHDQDLCFELVSPILMGDEGIESLRSIMNNVRALGIETNATCGFHIHVDAERNNTNSVGTLSAITSIAQCFVSLENAFDLIVAKADASNGCNTRRTNRNRFCRSNRIAFGSMSNKQRWFRIQSAQSVRELVDMVNPNNDRYRKLNLTNLSNPDRPSTCEFRHHGGVQDLQESEAWVRFILLFCHNAATTAAAPNGQKWKCLLPEEASVKDELHALFDLVGCQGLEQIYTVDRRLFQSKRLRNEWMCRVCRKRFVNSRSLSQHCQAVGH